MSSGHATRSAATQAKHTEVWFQSLDFWLVRLIADFACVVALFPACREDILYSPITFQTSSQIKTPMSGGIFGVTRGTYLLLKIIIYYNLLTILYNQSFDVEFSIMGSLKLRRFLG
jgi:hypothetical protein